MTNIHWHQPKRRKNIKPLGLSDSRASLVRALYDINRYLWRKIKKNFLRNVFIYIFICNFAEES
jgi:uncharacterized membrane protein